MHTTAGLALGELFEKMHSTNWVLPEFAWMNVYEHRFSNLTLQARGSCVTKCILSHLYLVSRESLNLDSFHP